MADAAIYFNRKLLHLVEMKAFCEQGYACDGESSSRPYVP